MDELLEIANESVQNIFLAVDYDYATKLRYLSKLSSKLDATIQACESEIDNPNKVLTEGEDIGIGNGEVW